MTDRQKVFWAWLNKRTKIAHCYTAHSGYPVCGAWVSKWHAHINGASRRCKNCERARVSLTTRKDCEKVYITIDK